MRCLRSYILRILMLAGFLSWFLPEVSATEESTVSVLRDHQTGKPIPYAGDFGGGDIFLPVVYEEKPNEFRGVWITTQWNLDYQACVSAPEFIRQISPMLDRIKRAGFNAIIFQVRPSSDAFYPSKLNPWSKYLTGQEGRAMTPTGFDPLRTLISETHRRGLEFHAWLNPFRVVSSTAERNKQEFLKTLSPDNFAAKNPDLVLGIPTSGKIQYMLNPGEPRVQLFLVDTVHEILRNYKVDAIHFDDYFYPYQEMGQADILSYRKLAPKGMAIEDWRRENVTTFVRAVRSMMTQFNRENNRNVRFGISPFGIWANRPAPKDSPKYPRHPLGSRTRGMQSYFTQYADTRKWVREGLVDYVAPQVYWPFAQKQAPYAAIADWWADVAKGTGVDLYIGTAPFRVGVQPEWKHAAELSNQLKFNMLRPEIKGAAFYSYRSLFRPANSAARESARIVIEDLWKMKYTPETD